MQLSIFDVINDTSALQVKNQNREFLGFKEYIGEKAYDKLQSLAGQTFLFQYSSPFVHISVPIKYSKTEMMSKPNPLINIGRLYSVQGNKYDSILAGSTKQLYQLLEDESNATYHFTFPKNNLYHPVEEFMYSANSCLSGVTLQEKEYKLNKLSSLQEIQDADSEDEVLQGLIGQTLKVEFYLRDEIFWNIVSAPFEVKNIDIRGTEIWITGTNDVHLYANHFQKIRHQHPTVLFDCFVPGEGCFSYALKAY